MLKYALYPPEAATRDHRGLQAIGGLNVQRGSGDHHRVFGSTQWSGSESGDRQRAYGGVERKAAELAGHKVPLRMAVEAQFRAAVAVRNRPACPDVRKYVASPALLPPAAHELVNEVHG